MHRSIFMMISLTLLLGCGAGSSSDGVDESASDLRHCKHHICPTSSSSSGSTSGTSSSGSTTTGGATSSGSSTTGGTTGSGSTGGTSTGGSSTSGSTGATGQAIQTVFVILMENHNWSSIEGNTSEAPYINGTLLPMAAHAEQYYNPPGNHPSEPNYIWLEAGSNMGITDDNDATVNRIGTTDHLVTYLSRAGFSWRSYQENIDGTTCPLSSVYPYAAKHNPLVFFDDITGGGSFADPTCIEHNRPYSELVNDLQNGTVAQYNFITPNLCNDMHDCSISRGDAWLSQQVPMIMASAAYQNGGAIFLTWDEGEGSDGPIGMIVLSPAAKGNGYANTIHYTHSSTLRTMQEIFHVGPLLRDAANATDLSDLFMEFP